VGGDHHRGRHAGGGRDPDAWKQPILRFVDTLIGVAIGVAAAWIGVRLLRQRIEAR
jgi:hypothetical protein